VQSDEQDEKHHVLLPSEMVAEFSQYCSAERLSVLLGGIQALADAGLPVIDIADALYSDPRVLDALKDGDYDKAKHMTIARIRDGIKELRASGVPEDRLRILNQSGFSVAEIAFVFRNFHGMSSIMKADVKQATRWAPVLHEFFRKGGRPTHGAKLNTFALDNSTIFDSNSNKESWFDQYLRLTETTEGRPLG
jgi:hypothetical protein